MHSKIIFLVRTFAIVVFPLLVSVPAFGQDKGNSEASLSPHVVRPSLFSMRRSVAYDPRVGPYSKSNEATFKQVGDAIAQFEKMYRGREGESFVKACEKLSAFQRGQVKQTVDFHASWESKMAALEEELRKEAKDPKYIDEFVRNQAERLSTLLKTHPTRELNQREEFLKALNTPEKRADYYIRFYVNTVKDAAQLKKNPAEFEDFFRSEVCPIGKMDLGVKANVKALEDFQIQTPRTADKLRTAIDAIVPKLDKQMQTLEEKARKGTLKVEEAEKLDYYMEDYMHLVALKGHLALRGQKREPEFAKAQIARIDERLAQLVVEARTSPSKKNADTRNILTSLKKDLSTEGNLHHVGLLQSDRVQMSNFVQLLKAWGKEENKDKGVAEMFGRPLERDYHPSTPAELRDAVHLADAFTRLLQSSAQYVVMMEEHYQNLGLPPGQASDAPMVAKSSEEQRRERLRQKYAYYTK